MLKIAIFASGSGSNAENIIHFLREREEDSVVGILCNVSTAYVLERAAKLNVPTCVFSREQMKDPDFLMNQLKEWGAELIVLAGFLWKLPDALIAAFPNRVINIHPALLPSYGGKGMYGAHVHEAVINAREKQSGITIHYVNNQYDSGEILFQAACPVLPDDTPEALASRVHALEYRYFPVVVERLAKEEPALPFVHLHVHSQYSILDGEASLSGLVKKAKGLGMKALALTDHGDMFGVKTFYDECKKAGIKPILGVETYVARTSRHEKSKREDRSGEHLILLAKNLTGYINLVRLCSLARMEGMYYHPRIDKELLEKYHEGLIVSSACLGGEICQKILAGQVEEAEATAAWFKNLFGEDYYLELMRHPSARQEWNGDCYPQEMACAAEIKKIAEKLNIKLIATNDVHFLDEDDAEAHDVLICLNTNADFEDPNRMRYTRQEWMKSQSEMSRLFCDMPEVLDNTAEIVEKVETYKLDSDPIMPVFPIPESFGTIERYRETHSEADLIAEFPADRYKKLGGYEKVLRIKFESDYLSFLVAEGAKKRWGETFPSPEYKERIEFELNTIKEMGFPGYFLIVHDYINAAREMGVIVGPGRGSAAGSAVAYCLHITNINPIEYDLLFERFLNPDRVSMPDIDVDFDDDGRQQVLDWVANKYGRERVAHIVTFGTMAAKLSIRDVARILSLDLPTADRLAKLVPDRIDGAPATLAKAYKEVPELAQELLSGNEKVKKTLNLALKLEGCIRQPGAHPCGVIISRDPLIETVPVMPTKDDDLLTTEYEGSLVEPIGLLKMDFLGLRTLSIIKKTLALIKKLSGKVLDIDSIPLDDQPTFDLFSRGETIGIFQFEKEYMQGQLRLLQPGRFEDLVAMNALNRPGPMEYIPTYIRRKHRLEPVQYDHPMMEFYLKGTFGITIYQEQVMLQSRALGLLTRGESDSLRKAMGKKKIELMEKLKQKFVSGCQNNPDFVKGCEETHKDLNVLVEKIWEDWRKFSGYAFNKSHSVCYAYLAYQMAYLKTHYPAEFMAGTLSCNLSDIGKVTVFMQECHRMGLNVLLPDVNESDEEFTVTPSGNIRFGLNAIKNVGENAVEAIVSERKKNGPYKDPYDFFERIDYRQVNKRVLDAMISAGALDSFGWHRARYFGEVEGICAYDKLIQYGQHCQEDRMGIQNTLFGDMEGFSVPRPELPECSPWNELVQSEKEKELIGTYLSVHPLDNWRAELNLICTPIADLLDLDLFASTHKEWVVKHKEFYIGGIITDSKKYRTKKGDDYIKISLEDFSGTFSQTFFGESASKYEHLLNIKTRIYLKAQLYSYKGKEGMIVNAIRILNVYPLAAMREDLVRQVVLSVPLHHLTSSLVDSLMDIIKIEKGKDKSKVGIPLYFKLVHEDGSSLTLFARAVSVTHLDLLYDFCEKISVIKMKLS